MTNQAAAPTARGLRVQLLGGFRVSSDGRIAGEGGWRLAKARTLVKLLALAPGHRLHRDEVQDLLWPELPWKAASNNFHRALHFARQAVGVPAQYLQLRWGILTLCVDDSIWIDVDEFEAAAAAACRGRDPAMYEAALGLYTGDLLPEDQYEEWTTQRRSDLRQEYLGLLVALSRLHEGNGELDAAVAALRRVLAAEPAAEEAHAGLMRLHALADRLHESAQQYQALRKALKQHLDTEPAETTERLYQEILDGQLRATATGRAARPAAAVAPASRLTLPHAASSFVGREIEIATVNEMLSATRLLTLVGPAGCGKTRLALRVAADRSHEYRDGAWLTDLGAVQDPDSVARAMARALGLGESPGDRAAAAVAERLRSAETLLMLDTCEHVVAACATLVGSLLQTCPHLHVLATSREPLRLAGEVVWRVPCMALAVGGRVARCERPLVSDAVRLFGERAGAAAPGFGITKQNAAAVGEICRRLDGLPLAIEMAAGLVRVLAPEQIAARLDDRFGLLAEGSRTAPPRQQSLRAAVDWSYALLSPAERALFSRLAVCADTFTLDAAEAVGPELEVAPSAVVGLLARLVDRSMVVAERDASGAVRYRLLETLRAYGQARLAEEAPAPPRRTISRRAASSASARGRRDPLVRN